MIIKGFKFGLILQFAVGPISLFILQVALTSGFKQGLKGVAGVTIVDGLFIIAAILGIGTLINNNPKIKNYLKYGGGIVLLIFGITTILGVFGYDIMPSFSLATSSDQSVFVKSIIMTAANPLTIVFWAGVFSTKISEYNMTKQMMYLFGIGAVASTLICMSLLAFLGDFLSVVVNPFILVLMNFAVGIFLIGFAIKTLLSD